MKLSKTQLKRWISKEEYKLLLSYGYRAVKLKARILGKDGNQCVFASSKPLNEICKEFKLYN